MYALISQIRSDHPSLKSIAPTTTPPAPTAPNLANARLIATIFIPRTEQVIIFT